MYTRNSLMFNKSWTSESYHDNKTKEIKFKFTAYFSFPEGS